MLRAVARALTWPLRRFFDPRFDRIQAHVDARNRELTEHLGDLRAEALQLNHDAVVARGDIAATSHRIEELLQSDTAASAETASLFGRSLADLLERSEEILGELHAGGPPGGGAAPAGDLLVLVTTAGDDALAALAHGWTVETRRNEGGVTLVIARRTP